MQLQLILLKKGGKTVKTRYNILKYTSSINTWPSGDSSSAQLIKELDLCLFLCGI